MKTIALLGGDCRQTQFGKRLLDEGNTVLAYGVPNFPRTASLDNLWEAEEVLLPLPATKDGVRVFQTEETVEPIRLQTLLSKTPKLLFGGKIPATVREQVEKNGGRVFDCLDSEYFQVQNALLTVEGAIRLAAEQLPITIYGCEIAIFGYGRIGKLLTKRLTDLGAQVTVYERNRSQRAWIEIQGGKYVPFFQSDGTSSLLHFSKTCRLLFNTVPEWILTREILPHFPTGCKIIDLASSPGGVDLTTARQYGIFPVIGSALPGKYFPESAGNCLFDVWKQLHFDSSD